MKKLKILICLILLRFTLGCSESCKICKSENNMSIYDCSECIDGYEYDLLSHKCQIKSICERYQFSDFNDGNFKCVSICKHNKISLTFENTCNQIYQCSSQSIYPSSLSKGRYIADIFRVDDYQVLIIYNNFANLISLQDGKFIYQFNFDENIIFIRKFRQMLYLFSRDRKVYSWNIQYGNPKFLISQQNGFANNKNDILYCHNNQERVMVVSVFEQQKEMILSEINSNSDDIVLQYPNKAFIKQNLIIFQDAFNRVMILRLFEGINSQLIIQQLTTIYLCSYVKGEINQILEIGEDFFYLIFLNTLGIAQINQSSLLCQFIESDLQPLKIDLTASNLRQPPSQIVFSSFQSNDFKAIFVKNEQSNISIRFLYEILDFGFSWMTQYQAKIYFLLSDQSIQVYNFQFDIEQNQFLPFQKIINIQTVISNPKKLIILDSYTNQQAENYLCILSQDLQIVTIQNDNINGITIDITQKVALSQKNITKIILNEELNLLASCSLDGKVQFWNLIDIYNPVFHYSLEQPNQSCLDIALDYSQILIAKFTSQILLFDLYRKQIVQTIPIDNTFSYFQIVNQQIFIIFSQTLKLFKDFNEILTLNISSEIQSVFVSQQNKIYIISTSNTINAFTIDLDKQILVQDTTVNSYSSTKPITKVSFFEIGNSKIYIMVNADSNYLEILSENLTIIIPSQQLAGALLSIYQYSNSEYIFIQNAPLKNKALPIALQYYDIQVNQFIDIIQLLDILQISNARLFKGIAPNPDYFQLSYVASIGFSYINSSIKWQKPNFMLNDFVQQTEGRQIKYLLNNKQLTVNYIGNDNGSIQYANYAKDLSIQRVFSLDQASTTINDKIQFIKYSFVLGYYYIVALQNVYIYNFSTNSFEEKIAMNPSQSNSDNIIDIQISEKIKIVIIYTRSQLYIKNHNDKSFLILQTAQQNSKLKLIYGIYFDEKQSLLYIYGDTIVQSDIKLTSIKTINPINQANYQICLFFSQVFVCKHDTNKVSFFQRDTYFSLIQVQSFFPPYSQNFQILSDQVYENIFIVSNIIDVFNFQGTFKKTLNLINQNFISLDLAGIYFIVFTPAIGYIVNRESLAIQTTFSSSAGNLVKGYYLKEINILAYVTTEVRYGQVKLYSLQTLSNIGTLQSTFLKNLVGSAIKIYYDVDTGVINFVDNLGNIYNNRYGSQSFIDSQTIIQEVNSLQTPEPKDYFIDFNLNDIYLYNNIYVWKLNYNTITRAYVDFYQTSKRYYIIIKQSGLSIQSGQEDVSIYFCDNTNKIFYYYQSETVFIKQIEEPILEMRSLNQKNSQISLIIYPSKIKVYTGSSIDLKNDKFDYQLDLKILMILYDQFNIVIIQTTSNQIIEYDFVENKVIQQFQIDQNLIINSQCTISDQSRISYWNLYLALSNGRIVKYDILNKQFQIYSAITTNDQIVKLLYLENNMFVLTMKSGQLIEVNSIDFSKLPTQILNDKVQKISSQMQLIEGQVQTLIDFDNENKRLFINVNDNKYLSVYNILDNYSFLTNINFPDNAQKKIKMTKNFQILYCSFQLNIYSRVNLNYIGRFRKNIRQKQIQDIIEVYENFLAIKYQSSFETIIINDKINYIVSINQIQINDATLIYYKSYFELDTIIMIGISKQGIFYQTVSISYILQQGKISDQQVTSNQIQACNYDINYQSSVQAQIDFAKIENFQYNNQEMFFSLSILINNEINDVSFISQENSMIVLRPYNNQNKNLNIREKSLQNIPFNVKLIDFDLIFQNQGIPTNFHENTQNITLQNINISNQSIQKGTQILFQNKKIIQIQGLTISDLNMIEFSSRKRNLQNKNIYDTLFKFSNCEHILIEDLYIYNLNQESLDFQLFEITDVQNVIIKNLQISNSVLVGNLIKIISIQNLRIEQIQIRSNQKSEVNKDIISYLIQIEGVQEVRINNIEINDNQDLNMIKLSDFYEKDEILYTLKDSTIVIQDSKFNNNIYPNTFNKDTQVNLLYLQTSIIYLIKIQYSKNQGNIFITSSKSVFIDQSQFNNNLGITGAALQLITLTDLLYIDNTKFQNNQAKANGGSLCLIDVFKIQITDSCQFKDNSALIGGAIRFQVSNIKNQEFLNFQINSNIFEGNNAQIFGKNIGTYPYKFVVQQYQGNLNSLKVQEYEGYIFKNNEEKITFISIQSGSNLFLQLYLKDDNDQFIFIDTDSLENKFYPQLIIDELESYNFELQQQLNSNKIEVKGEPLITVRQYNQEFKTFQFNNLIVGGFPQKTISQNILSIKLNNWIPMIELDVSLQFRSCLQGEIPVQSTSSVIYCKECQTGTYSIEIYDIYSTSNNQNSLNQLSCKKCPIGATSCEKNKLTLKSGYWRENIYTDEILKCNEIDSGICNEVDEDYRFGCSEGHLGPLCEQCDFFSDIWNATYNQQGGQYQCNKCSGVSIQIAYILFIIFLTILYLCASIHIFMNNFKLNSTYTYLRFMKVLPYSRSCIQDESTTFIKCLVNYLQISSILVTMDFKILPTIFTFLPNLLGKPIERLSVSFQCFYNEISEIISSKDVIRINYIFYTIFPFILFIFLFIFFYIIRKLTKQQNNHQYYYMIINITFFFFQPDSINYLSTSLVCRQIGSKKYAKNNLTMMCGELSQQSFRRIAISFALTFWVILPLIILLKFIKDKRATNNLYSCTMKYKYGYYYLEYKQQYYYWEFIRVYVKLAIVLSLTIIEDISDLKQSVSILIIGIYLYLIELFYPFQTKQLCLLEKSTLVILILTAFLSLIQSKTQSDVVIILIIVVHYTTIFILLTIIILKKVEQTLQNQETFLNFFARKLLKKNTYQQLTTFGKRKLKILLYWKQIYQNLKYLRSLKVNEHIKQLEEHSQKMSGKLYTQIISNFTLTIILEKDLSIGKQKLSSVRSSLNAQKELFNQKNQRITLSLKSNKGLYQKIIQKHESIFSMNSDLAQKRSINQHQENLSGFVLATNENLINRNMTEEDDQKHMIFQKGSSNEDDNINLKKEVELNEQKQKDLFPNINASDFEETYFPQQVYQANTHKNQLQ